MRMHACMQQKTASFGHEEIVVTEALVVALSPVVLIQYSAMFGSVTTQARSSWWHAYVCKPLQNHHNVMLVFGQTILRCVQTVRLYIRTYVLDTMTYAA